MTVVAVVKPATVIAKIGRTPSGSAGGDLAGVYPNPSVAKVAGVTPSAFHLTLLPAATATATNTLLGLGVGNVVTFLGLVIAGSVVNTPASISGTINDYQELNVQNLSSGIGASSDVSVTANDGTATTRYGNFGINGSGWTGTTWGGPRDVYLYASDNDLWIGTNSAGKVLRLNAAGGAAAQTVATISSTGFTVNNGFTVTLPAASIADAALSSSVALLTGTQTFSGGKTFSLTARFNAAEAITIGGAATAGNGVIQTPAGTTQATGWCAGGDTFLFRDAANSWRIPGFLGVRNGATITADGSSGATTIGVFTAQQLTSAIVAPILSTKTAQIQAISGENNENQPGLFCAATFNVGSSSSRGAGFDFVSSRSTKTQHNTATRVALLINDVIGEMSWCGDDGTTIRNQNATIRVTASENQSSTTRGCVFGIDTIANGGTAKATRLQIDSGGNLIVSTGNITVAGKFGCNGATPPTRSTYAAWTGTATRTTIATGSATTANCAEAIKALIDDLRATGLLG